MKNNAFGNTLGFDLRVHSTVPGIVLKSIRGVSWPGLLCGVPGTIVLVLYNSGLNESTFSGAAAIF